MEKTKILIVEDETIIALDIKRALEKMDYEVTNMVYDYQGDIKSVKINRPDLILMDVNLGNSKDGIETAKDFDNKTIKTKNKNVISFLSIIFN